MSFLYVDVKFMCVHEYMKVRNMEQFWVYPFVIYIFYEILNRQGHSVILELAE